MHKKAPADWRAIQRQNFIHWEPLADFLELTLEQRDVLLKQPQFSLNLPLRLAKKITKSTLEDPILKQFLPTKSEMTPTVGFSSDPIGDNLSRKSSKLLHKYDGRALLVCTSACAMHCRFCFRQKFDYETQSGFEEELALIAADNTLHEIILSGGDPLSLSNQTLKSLLDRLTSIPHVKRIRFHSRFPIGIPERIDDGLISILASLKQSVWFVVHVNHASELDYDILERLAELRKQGILVLNQCVLLKGINDNIDALKTLCEMLVDNGIFPYYLHQLDKVVGAAHFEVEEAIGVQLIRQLAEQLPGYAVPKYVREISGEPSKTSLL
jgi:EF-P beta-lysylation protein EpmB